MLPELALGKARPSRLRDALPEAWRAPLARLAASWFALIVLCADDWRDMADQWWNSSTFNHILLVPFIIGWLVTIRRHEVARLPVSAWWPGLVLVGGAAFVWVLGSFAGLSVLRQLGAVVMLQGAVAAILGPHVAAGLAFPLAYMLFLVPLGEEIVPQLQLVTARLAVTLLDLTNIPAVLQGVFITTPAGYFEVAEACSGAKFLVAMIALGALVANVCFVSPLRRCLFMATCIVVPIVANGIRAWGTIGIAEWRGIEFASGFDHVLYGWFFFAFVIALVMGLAWRYFDRAPTGHTIDAERIMSSRPLSRLAEATIGAGAAIGLIMLIATAAFGWSTAAGRLAAKLPAQVDLPQVSGWHRVTYSPAYPWEPLHGGAEHRLLGSYADTEGRRVEVSYALYASQGEGREAGGFGQGAMPPDSGWAWRSPGPAIAGSIVQRLSAPGPVEREAATFYRSGSVLTGSNIRLKLANIADRLFLRAHPTAVLIVSAEEREGAPADEAIRRFLRAGGPTGPWMDRIGRTR